MRCGRMGIPLFIMLFGTLYLVARNAMSVGSLRAICSNMYYPGRQMIRPFGVPHD